jgi:hypothetical protein
VREIGNPGSSPSKTERKRPLEFFNCDYMVLESTQLLTEMSTRNVPGGKEWPARKSDLTAVCEPIAKKMWQSRHLQTLWTSTASYRDDFTFLLPIELADLCVMWGIVMNCNSNWKRNDDSNCIRLNRV